MDVCWAGILVYREIDQVKAFLENQNMYLFSSLGWPLVTCMTLDGQVMKYL